MYNFFVHMRSHTKEMPFQCLLCQKAFSRLDSLNVHKRSHTKEKPFQCLFCQKSFTTSGELNVHKPSHTKIKPFQCLLCQKDFTNSSNLNVHSRRQGVATPPFPDFFRYSALHPIFRAPRIGTTPRHTHPTTSQSHTLPSPTHNPNHFSSLFPS